MKRRNFQKSAQIQEYHAKRFKNPFFEGEEEKQRRTGRFIVVLFILLVFTVPLVLIIGPFYRIHSVSVSGLTTIPVEDVVSMAEGHLNGKWAGIFPQNHAWFAQLERLERRLQQSYQFETLTLELVDHVLTLSAEERISELVYRSGSDFYFLNLDGTLLRELYPEERRQIHERIGIETVSLSEEELRNLPPLQPNLPIIQDMSAAGVAEGLELLLPITAEHIIAVDKQLRVLDIEPIVYQIQKPHAPWFTITTNNGFNIYMDAVEDPGVQLYRLQTVFAERTVVPEDISYIDIRFPNRVYVK